MLTLVVERSTCRPGWALFRDMACLQEAVTEAEPSRTPDWLPLLNDALAAAGVSLAEIDRFAVGLGPGSFSGIRAAVAALQGAALPGSKPLFGVSSAAALAYARLIRRAELGLCTPVSVVGDARRERLWCAVYTLSERRLMVHTASGIRTPSHDAADFTLTTWADLPALLPPGTQLASPDRERMGARLAACLPPEQLEDGVCMPSAVDVGRLLLSDLDAAHLDPLPIYLHPAVAEARA